MSFYNMAIVKGVITLGRSDALEWVTQYKIRYQYDYYSEWNWYEEPPGTVKVSKDRMSRFICHSRLIVTINNDKQIRFCIVLIY